MVLAYPERVGVTYTIPSRLRTGASATLRLCEGGFSMSKTIHPYRVSSLEERFWTKVNKNGPIPSHKPELGCCWPWTGAKNPKGYGRISKGKRPARALLAHRVAWFLATGEWPQDDIKVLHRCDNPPCVRKSHLFTGTSADNSRDMKDKGRVPYGENHAGHILTDEKVIAIMQAQGTIRQLSVKFDVSHTTVRRIKRGITRTYITNVAGQKV